VGSHICLEFLLLLSQRLNLLFIRFDDCVFGFDDGLLGSDLGLQFL
jgi:hypothetical protein